MALATDPGQQRVAIAVIALFVGLVAIHLGLAFWIGLTTRGAQTWKSLAGLAAGTAVAWLVVGLVVGYVVILDNQTAIIGPSSAAFDHTFSVPFQWNIPGRFFNVSSSEVPGNIIVICTTGVVALIAYVLAVFAAICARLYLRASAWLKR